MLLDRVLEPVGDALGPETARRLVALQADSEVQQRMDDLAERANEGTLSPEERSEYEALVAMSSVLAILQAKARMVLARDAKSLRHTTMAIDAELRELVWRR